MKKNELEQNKYGFSFYPKTTIMQEPWVGVLDRPLPLYWKERPEFIKRGKRGINEKQRIEKIKFTLRSKVTKCNLGKKSDIWNWKIKLLNDLLLNKESITFLERLEKCRTDYKILKQQGRQNGK
ncbi:MAG: hypothetical protein LBT02_03490 [Rickettsiales bacterium]|jgi:hypothetical protein|nr:hypothetical protein [Rickettsiales bacterium]